MTEENVENKPNEVPETTPTAKAPDPQPKPVEGLKASENVPTPIFNLKLKAKTLLGILTAIAVLIDEATFNITAASVNLKAMDPSRVAMVVFNYPREAFEEFNVSREGLIAFDIGAVLKIVKRADKDENIELIMLEQSPKLLLKIHGKAERIFDIPTLDPSTEELPTPKLNHEATIKIVASALHSAVEDAVLVSDHTRVYTLPESFEFKAAGDMLTGNIKFVKGSHTDLIDLTKQDLTKATSAIFSLEYFKEITKALKDVGDIATLQYATDMPIQIDVQTDKGSMTFYQAPRIEVE